jgi:hypothetical protein
VAALRKAFDAAVKDPALIADANKKRLPLDPTDYKELTAITAKVIATPPEIAAMAK